MVAAAAAVIPAAVLPAGVPPVTAAAAALPPGPFVSVPALFNPMGIMRHCFSKGFTEAKGFKEAQKIAEGLLKLKS